ncbi:MAG: hypothetical protein ACFCUN_02705 [Hyphomicrobiaceae bacterium]
MQPAHDLIRKRPVTRCNQSETLRDLDEIYLSAAFEHPVRPAISEFDAVELPVL